MNAELLADEKQMDADDVRLEASEHAEKVDRLQFECGKLPQLAVPLTHHFIPGFYIRQITMPKGALVISRIHKTTHPFVISKGHAAVMDECGHVEHFKAPYSGITTPGSRRTIFIHEDCTWSTFHAGDWPADMDPKKIEDELTDLPDVSYVGKLAEEKLPLVTAGEPNTGGPYL